MLCLVSSKTGWKHIAQPMTGVDVTTESDKLVITND
ncbi:hypothetical protein Mal48_40360 [Thalassoglobus polymorphus]|uniref:Uncharacterized protein n=1 Tax=Thalassoglobus polymorphus TaxID=2527994 RepID=A0A517QSZ3_9PLAN|nr:hypothetical protein Mal48_40360 [Thalassoglobus polymorphus]